jgi:NADPH:quinone reductase-like Zn-dependent oxidoreductase
VRAVVIVGGAIGIGERGTPTPRRHELLVRVAAAGLNAADLLQRAGLYPPPAHVDGSIPGLELAGVVEATGRGVTMFSPGDPVMGLVAGAAQAELAVVDERNAFVVPAGVSWAEAGGFAEAFCTAHDALVSQGGLVAGERVLVNGAAGGVGLAAIQLAVALGADVTATVRNERRRSAVAAFGARVVAPGETELGAPYDVVLELVGAPNLAGDLASLGTAGRIVVIGVGAGVRAEVDLRELMARRARLMGSTLRARSIDEKAAVVTGVARDVIPLFAARRVVVPLDATFPFERAHAAYEHFSAPGKLGKIVLVFGGFEERHLPGGPPVAKGPDAGRNLLF